MIDESMPPRLEGRAGAWRMLGPEMTSPPRPLPLFLGFLWEHVPLYQPAERDR